MRHWQHTPPAALQLKRIGLFLGLKPDRSETAVVTTAKDALREATAAGLSPSQGRPNDPLLDLVGW